MKKDYFITLLQLLMSVKVLLLIQPKDLIQDSKTKVITKIFLKVMSIKDFLLKMIMGMLWT